MSDLIRRQDAIDALKRDEEYDEDIPNRADGVRDAIITISNLPTAELPIKEKCCVCPHCDNCDVNEDGTIERKKGEWINVTNGRGGMECSNCHAYSASYKNGDDYLSNFCPNCGADMKGDKDGL